MRLMKLPLYVTLLCLLIVCSRPAAAQGALDPSAEPSGGTAALAPAFTPDPFRTMLTGGGDVDANSRALGQECFGFISIEPDFRLTAQGSFSLLRFIFIADTITTDTTLIVRTPDGRYLCNNDAFGIFNPMVDVANAVAGDYAVWIGGFSPNRPVYGDLYVTGNSSIIPGSTGVVIPIPTATLQPTAAATTEPTPVPGGALNAGLPPAHGRMALASGFLPDPYWAVVVGGGQVSVPALNDNTVEGISEVLPECGGFSDSAPDFRVEWSGRSTRLRFHFIPAATHGLEPDAALIVQSPDGVWSCNRDFAPGFSRPSTEFVNPIPGAYHVWVADEAAAGTTIGGVLYITEIASTPETVRQAAALPVPAIEGLDAGSVTSAVTDLTFSTDPFIAPALTGGGFVNLDEFNPDLNPLGGNTGCVGFYSSAPTLVLNLGQSLPYLRAFFVADDESADPTLIVRMPDGQWYCGDDSFSTKSPTLNIIGNPSSGIVRVWAGNYEPESFISGTLYMTRGDAAPSTEGVAGAATPTLTIADTSFTPEALPTTVVLPTAPAAANPAGLDPLAAPSYGSVSLGTVFAPYTAEVSGGGDVDVSPLGEECVGYVARPPDYRVQWSGGSFLRFYMVSLGDTTLVVLSPDAVWHCNDDSFVSVNPTVDVENAVPGAYNIWIGSFDQGVGIPGTLYITEDANRNPGN
jgi:hypothetical protein